MRGGATSFAHFARTTSTMDEAHRLAGEGARSGLVVVADVQEQGRGRGGNRWSSARPLGLWITLVERPRHVSALGVLALRVGLRTAVALDALADAPIQLKWPNDLYVDGRKLGGILVESRWRGDAVDWIAIGLGINLAAPSDHPDAGCLSRAVTRADALEAVVPALRTAAAALSGGSVLLDASELREYHQRDVALGALLREPVAGRIEGISPEGALRVRTPRGDEELMAGSLIFAEADWASRRRPPGASAS